MTEMSMTYWKETTITVMSGKRKNKGTFIVKILNRQSSTWQGSVTWVEEQQTQNFRSALELIKMIDGALEEDAEIEGESHEREK